MSPLLLAVLLAEARKAVCEAAGDPIFLDPPTHMMVESPIAIRYWNAVKKLTRALAALRDLEK